MKRPARLINFLLSSIILSSCGGGNSKITTTFDSNALLSEEHPISTDERNIATRICFAYQSKSIKFRTADFQGKGFNFKTDNTNCANIKTSSQVNASLSYDGSNSLTYISSETTPPNFMSRVQTDTNGYLSQLCTKIKNNESINNTTTSGAVKVQISFMREDMDAFVLHYFVNQNNNAYKIQSAEKFKIRTQMNYTNGQILGMDEFYSTQKICDGSKDLNAYSNFEQTFIAH